MVARSVSNDPAGHLGQPCVVGAGVAAHPVEGRVHGEVAALGEHPLGLLDDHSTVQRGLELLGEHLTAADGAFGQDPDRRDVGQRLTQRQVSVGQRAGLTVEQVQCPDRFAPQSQR